MKRLLVLIAAGGVVAGSGCATSGGDANAASQILRLDAEWSRAAGERDFQVSLLDFLLANEPLLLEFCQDASTPPQVIHKARFVMEA